MASPNEPYSLKEKRTLLEHLHLEVLADHASHHFNFKLGELYDRVLENLQHSTPEIKALALDALDIKVYAWGTDDIEMQGVIPLELTTTGQTSGCLCFYRNIRLC